LKPSVSVAVPWKQFTLRCRTARSARFPLGTTAAEIAQQISPRLAKEALVARITPLKHISWCALGPDRETARLARRFARPARSGCASFDLDGPKDPDAIQVLRHSARAFLAAAVLELFPNVKLGIGPPIDTGFFLRFCAREPFTPEDLERIEKKMRELAAQDIPNERKMMPQARGTGALPQVETRASNAKLVEERAGRADGFVLHHWKIHRFLPRAAHSFHRTHPRIQADERCRRLLERSGRQTRRCSASTGRASTRSRSSTTICTNSKRPSGAITGASGRAGFVFDSGRGRAGTDFLAPERRPGPQVDGGLACAMSCCARGYDLVYHAAHHAPGFVEDQRTHRLLPREYVRRRRSRKGRLSVEADELPWPYLDLQVPAAQLSRASSAPWPNSAPCIATNARACCTASCASADSRRTTRTSLMP